MFRYGATTLQANTWYHVAGVYDAASSALHVYLNGQLDDGVLVGTVTSSQQNSNANVNIGQRPTGGFQTNGRIDNVRVYSSALSAAQLQADMATPVSSGGPPPVSADLSITNTDSPDPVVPGGTLTYTLTVSNAGPSNATSVIATDTLPTGVTFVSATTGCAYASGTVTCTVGGLGATQSATRTITARTNSGDVNVDYGG